MSKDDRSWGFPGVRERAAIYVQGIVWISYSVCAGVRILEMIPVLCLILAEVCPGEVCPGVILFLACLSPNSDSMAAIVGEFEIIQNPIHIDVALIRIWTYKAQWQPNCQLHHFTAGTAHCSLHDSHRLSRALDTQSDH